MNEIRIGDSTFIYSGESDRQAKAVFAKCKRKVDDGIVNDSVFWIKNGIILRVHTPQDSFFSKLEQRST